MCDSKSERKAARRPLHSAKSHIHGQFELLASDIFGNVPPVA